MNAPLPEPLRDPLAERILFESPAVLVVHKPGGLAVDAPERGDDLARMVRRRREGAYVGVVHRLERDVSGPCVLSLDRAANARLAPPLERRTSRRTVVAAVGNAMSEAQVRRVIPSAKVIRKGANGALFEFDPRADKLQLFVERLGPALLAPLHVSALEVAVSERESSVIRAEIPWALLDAIEPGADALSDGDALVRRLRDGLWRRASVLADPRTTLVRLANEGGDSVAGLAVDRYGDFGVAHVYATLADDPARERVFAAVARAFGLRGIYAKYRPKQANTLIDTRREDVAPARAVWGESTEHETLVVSEHDVRYVTRLGDGLSTGIFVDQRENRRWVRDEARARSVLNLFAYTGAFSVAAAVGQATRSISVDASRGAIGWLREHLEANASVIADRSQHEGICAEVFGWLDGARARKDRYDLVVCDPPSYSFAKDGPRWSSERDWPVLAASVFNVCGPSSRALFCSNHRGISPAKFEAMVLDGARRAGVSIAAIESVGVPEDHPAARGEHGHLKTLRVRLR